MRTARFVALLMAAVWGWNSLFAGGLGPQALPARAQAAEASQAAAQARSLSLARDGRGTLWAAWEGDDGQDAEVHAAFWTGQEWAATPVARRPQAWDRAPSLAMAADGTPWLAWSSTQRKDPAATRIYVSRWTGSRWSSPAVVAEGFWAGECAACAQAAEPSLAAAPDGTMWLAWVGFDGREDHVFAQRWNGGVWSPPRQVSAGDGSRSLYDRQPQLAVGADGRPWVAWTGNQAGRDGVPVPGDDEIYASRWTGAEWAPEEMVSRDDEALDTAPALALDGWGQPWIAWQARVTEAEVSRRRIVVSRWDAARQAWTLESIASSPLAAEIDELHPSLATGADGAMQVAWVALADGEPALGYARREDSGWSAPRLVAGAAEGVSTPGEARLMDGETGAEVLWLDPLPQDAVPVRRFAVPAGPDNSLATWPAAEPGGVRAVTVEPWPYRFLAFGDSITWGGYPIDNPLQPPFTPYPSILEDALRATADPAYNVVNVGVSGERTETGADRIKLEVNEYRPHYVLIMEGTNDVSNDVPPAEVYDNLLLMLANATKYSGVDGVKVMLATIIPRLDGDLRLEQTRLLNELAVKAVASAKGVPLADQWQAFMDYGDWPSIMWDLKHPDQEGLQLIADTFYARIVERWVTVQDTVPPTTWIEPLPAASPCSGVTVSWNGTDNLSWVVDYDVQVQLDFGLWTDWLMGTTALSAVYTGALEGDQVGFRVRGRDAAGNLSEYGTPAYTVITDEQAPQAQVLPLPRAQKLPFTVSWQGSDGCSSIAVYSVQYRIGSSPTWLDWLVGTAATSAVFDPATPDYGQSVAFRAQARDQAGNWSAWSPEVSTLVARYTLGGQVVNVRGEPVAGAGQATDPAALAIVPESGGRFLAFLGDGGSYQVSASRDPLFGPLPPMVGVAVSQDVAGLTFVLPPLDDVVLNGGFEAGLGNWTPGGTSLPTPSSPGHTGLGGAHLDGSGGSASLRQVVNPTAGTATLSFMARLETPGEASTLQIVLSNEGSPEPPVTHTLSLASDAWTHAWYDLGKLQAEPLSLVLLVAGGPAVLVDEVSLGTAVPGGSWAHLPFVSRQ